VPARWLSVSDPAEYARGVLLEEAPDIPESLITQHPWHQDGLPLDAIHPDQAMINRHDSNPLHLHRCDTFVQALRRTANVGWAQDRGARVPVGERSAYVW